MPLPRYFSRNPYWMQRLFPHRVFHQARIPQTLYLTFDDGPIPEVTPWVLDLLAQYNAQATFFCVGDNVRKYPHIYARILDEGHQVGNHTMHHLNARQVSTKIYLDDVLTCKEWVNSKLFRPPYGRLPLRAAQQLRAEGFQLIMWEILSGDFDTQRTALHCADVVCQKSRPGSLIVFHDSIKAWPNLSYALPKVLSHFSRLGYHFLSLDD